MMIQDPHSPKLSLFTYSSPFKIPW